MTTTLDQHTIPRGFRFAAGTAGIKASGRPDVAIIEAPLGANAAAMFTRNRVAAAPVVVGRNHLAAARGKLRAIVVNAGNANCATGESGMRAAEKTCAQLAVLLGTTPEHILPSSTGIIGVPLPLDKLIASLPGVLASARDDAVLDVAQAIMTTDTRPKIASAVVRATGKTA